MIEERLAFIERVLRATEDTEGLTWTTSYWQKPDDSLEFFVNCNDFFAWACGDAERVTPDNIGSLELAFVDAKAAHEYGECWAGLLFCARMREMRPQGAYYDHLPEELWLLFDACGPLRETGIGNPKEHPSKRTPTEDHSTERSRA